MSEPTETLKPHILTLAALTTMLARVRPGTDANEFPDRDQYRDNPGLLELWANACIRVAARSLNAEPIATFHIEAADALRRRPGKWDTEDVEQLLQVGSAFLQLMPSDSARRGRLYSLYCYNAGYVHHADGNFLAAADVHNDASQLSDGVSERDRLLAIYHYTWEMLHFALVRDEESVHRRYSEYNLASRKLMRTLGPEDERWRINIQSWDLMFRWLVKNGLPKREELRFFARLAMSDDITELFPHAGKYSALSFLVGPRDVADIKESWEDVVHHAHEDMEWGMLHLYAMAKYSKQAGDRDTMYLIYARMTEIMMANHGGHLGYELAKSVVMGD